MHRFRHLNISNSVVELSPYFAEQKDTGTTMGLAAYEASNLADAAVAFFLGSYPIEAPYFSWGRSLALPWFSEYWHRCENGERAEAQLTEFEVSAIVKELERVAMENPPDRLGDFTQHTYRSPVLSESDKSKVQGLAVEVLLNIENALEYFSRTQPTEAALSLVYAYQCASELTVQVQLILGIASEKAKIGARARHRENHALKDEVFAWCDSNLPSYSGSLDNAAQEIAEKLVPVKFRAVRSWITDWRRLRSARRP